MSDKKDSNSSFIKINYTPSENTNHSSNSKELKRLAKELREIHANDHIQTAAS